MGITSNIMSASPGIAISIGVLVDGADRRRSGKPPISGLNNWQEGGRKGDFHAIPPAGATGSRALRGFFSLLVIASGLPPRLYAWSIRKGRLFKAARLLPRRWAMAMAAILSGDPRSRPLRDAFHPDGLLGV